MVTDWWCHLTNNSRGAWHTVYAMLLSNYKWDTTWNLYNGKMLFSITIIYSQLICVYLVLRLVPSSLFSFLIWWLTLFWLVDLSTFGWVNFYFRGFLCFRIFLCVCVCVSVCVCVCILYKNSRVGKQYWHWSGAQYAYVCIIPWNWNPV